MRDLMESIALTESDERFPPAVNGILDTIEQAMGQLNDAVDVEAKRYAAKLSAEWKDCVVAVYCAHGMVGAKIMISDEMVENVKSDDDYYDEVWNAVRDISDKNPISDMVLELDNVHRNAIGDFEGGVYMNGQELSWEAFLARSKQLGSLGWGSSNI